MHCIDKYSQHSSIIWPVWLNGWVFVYELSGCGLHSSCSNLRFRFHACFEQGVCWHSGNCRVWIHSEMGKWHDKSILFFKTFSKWYIFNIYWFKKGLKLYIMYRGWWNEYLIIYSKYCSLNSIGDVIYTKLGKKWLRDSCTNSGWKIKVNNKGKF